MSIDHEVCFSFESVTVDNTSTRITATVGVLDAHRAVITAEGGQMRFRYEGTAPTSTVGHVLNAGDRLILEGRANVDRFRAIRTGSVNGTLMVSIESI